MLLLSAKVPAEATAAEVRRLLARASGGVPVALLCDNDAELPEHLLALGALWVSRAVDVTSPDGWSRLQDQIADASTRIASISMRRLNREWRGAGSWTTVTPISSAPSGCSRCTVLTTSGVILSDS